MSERLNEKDVKTLEILLQYDSASSMYAYLQAKNYKYATLAESVVNGNSMSGAVAMNYEPDSAAVRQNQQRDPNL